MTPLKIPVEFSISKARKAQCLIAQKVIAEDRIIKDIRLIAGVDVAYLDDLAIGAVVVLNYKTLEVLETRVISQKVNFPYVPTLLAFREVPVAISCIRRLSLQPDVFLFDGHGRAHPYRCGLASHLGVALNKPTIGVAKSRLIGEQKEIGENNFLVQDGEIISALVQSQNKKPIFVSVGNLVTLETAVRIVKYTTHGRIPEPIRLAHKIASEERKAKIAGFPTISEKCKQS
jgi:deoxyribonuclease V